MLLIFSTCLIACQNKEVDVLEVVPSCVEKVLEEGNYTSYDGQEFDCCKGFLHLYELDEQEYFVYDNCCADLTFNAMDCDGQAYCEDFSDEDCTRGFFEQATYIRIIGFQE